MKKSVIAAVAASLVAAPTSLLVATAPVAGAWCNPWFPASCYVMPQIPQFHPQIPQFHPQIPQVQAPQFHPPAQVPQYHPPAQVPYHPPAQAPYHPQVPQQHPQVPQQHPQVPQQHPQAPQQHPQAPQQHAPQQNPQQHGPQQNPQQHPQAPQQHGPQQNPQQHPQGPQQHGPSHSLTPQEQHPKGITPPKAVVVAPPKTSTASSHAVEAARRAPAARINPVHPPKPPTRVDFNHELQKAVAAHSHERDLHGLVRPTAWKYIDYDLYHRPMLYNPLRQALTFHFFYDRAYRDVFVAAGARVVLDAINAGVYPFTAVGDDYLTAGSFDGGAFSPPDGWDGPPPASYVAPVPPMTLADVNAYVPAADQTVQVGKVTMVGHDDTQPAGSQDTFMLDDSTLAWGQANEPKDGGQITVTRTQPLPGVGPTDNGTSLITLASHEQPMTPKHNWLPWTLGGLLASTLGVGAWLARRFHRKLEVTPSTSGA
jgi:hypothetical protein